MLKTSVIIPTYNRPSELTSCIRSIINQTEKPDELIIVDDGNLREPPLQKECTEQGIQYRYLKKETPGLTESRNVGIRGAQGDIVFFFDDDVILSPEYIAEVLKIYHQDRENLIGGVGGITLLDKPLTVLQHLRRMLHTFFLTSGFREGKVLASGFVTDFGVRGVPLKKNRCVDFLYGYAMSFRKEIFQDISFDQKKYLGYGLGEDQDFSYRVSKKYKLMVTPQAKLFHRESMEMRPDQERIGRNLIIHRFVFFRDQVKQGWWSWFFFGYALMGFVVCRVLFIPLSGETAKFRRAKGIFRGVRDILFGRVPQGLTDNVPP